ncbi:MAG: S9 family peptidase [Acidobacteriota bacterium]
MNQTWLLIAAALFMATALPPIVGQQKRDMTLIDLLEIPQLRSPQLSPDGTRAVFVLQKADWKANKRIGHLWRVESDGSRLVQLTNGERGESDPAWSPDSRQIAFLAQREGDKVKQIHLIGPSGEARRLSRRETAPQDIAWSPDGKWIYFIAKDAKTPQEKARDEAKNDVFAFDEDYKQEHLWRILAGQGQEEKITQGHYSVRGFKLSRDGSRIAFHRAPTPLFDDSDEGEVWVMEADGNNALQLTRNQVAESGAQLSPDNSQVLFLSGSNEKFETYYNGNLFLVPAGGGAHRLLLPEMPYQVRQAGWSKDGESIFFLANMGLHSEIFQLELKGQRLIQRTDGKHSLRSWSYVPAIDRHIFQATDPQDPGDVWTLDPDSGWVPQRTSRIFKDLPQRFRIPRQERFAWTSTDGQQVEGLLYYPLDYQAGRKYPLVVQTHGGPASSDQYRFPRWSNYIPRLAALGYAVFKPNYRGSTGYGDDFLRDMVGHYYRNAHLDVMSGVDALIEKGIADPDRLVKMGWSAGGHMTNKIITFTDRFKAASSGAGAVNWVSMYAQSDVRIYRTPWFGGTPWQRDAPVDVYWEHSPLKDIWKVKTPTLVLVGENDLRVPAPQSVELYRALKANGVPTHLYIAPREPHGWRELRHELFKMNVELEWFEKHAMGREYQWEGAPEGNGNTP